ncbi:MAG: deoxyribose-phosphate aldolase, partial [Clostridia bacterium]|nr:deoxyribose-phosphate aldolase [Clostridia bacterium]
MSYTVGEILSHVDHTLLAPAATRAEILALCADALKYGTASVCIPAAYVGDAAAYLAGRIAVCTVIGFPNGYSTTEAKCFEARDAIARGADEIDMVINIGWLKDGRDEELCAEIAAVKEACGDKILKVIIETCLLTEE